MVKKEHPKSKPEEHKAHSPASHVQVSPEPVVQVVQVKVDSAEDKRLKEIITLRKTALENKLVSLQTQSGLVQAEISSVKQAITNCEHQLTLSGLNSHDIEPEKYNS